MAKAYLVIRIKGQADVPYWANTTLNLLKLEKKYRATILPVKENTDGMLKKIQHFVSWQEIDTKTTKELLDKKGRRTGYKKITTEDIIFSWNTLKEKGRPHTRSYYSLVEKAYPIGKDIIRFEFSEDSNYEMPLIIGLMPIFSKYYWNEKYFNKTTLKPIIGSGPYIIKKMDPGKHIIYEKIPNLWKIYSEDSVGRYNFQFIRYDFYREYFLDYCSERVMIPCSAFCVTQLIGEMLIDPPSKKMGWAEKDGITYPF